ncbi:aminotransferase class IV [Candidatus Peregrinibacteria bacterium]|nr:aminotransferase class IV [Candidatus Peregrinibacteria bacterium]
MALEKKDPADYINRPDYPEYNQNLIDTNYTGEERRNMDSRPQNRYDIVDAVLKETVTRINQGEEYKPLRGLSERVDNIIKTAETSETKEYYFSINTLPYFQAQSRMLMSKGLVPTIRLHSKDRYGAPVWPIDEKLIQLESLPKGAFISLVKCPKYFRACNFIPPLDVDKVKKAAEKGCSKNPKEREEGLGFTDKFSHTTHISVATTENGAWDGPIMIPNTTYECYPLEQIKQYGTGLFEGIGVEKTEDGQVVIFRLDEHIKRMYEGGKIYDMFPDLETEEDEAKRFEKFKDLYTKMVIDTIRANWKYIPDYGKGRLYIRPCFFDHGEKMHADTSGKFMMTITAVPIGSAESYFKPGVKVFFMALKRSRTVEHSPEGMAKAVGNYARPVRLLHKTAKKGMAGVIYTNRKGDRTEESHASSVLFILTMKNGSKKIITPSLHHGTILDSITRKTSLTLAANELGWETEERQINPLEILLYSIATKDPNQLKAIEMLMDKTTEIDEVKKLLKETLTCEEIEKIMPTLQKLAKNIASDTRDNVKKEYLETAKNLKRVEPIATGTAAAITSMHQIQMGEADRKTDEIKEDKYQELIVFDHEHTGKMGPASKELFDLLLSVKSGKLQRKMREEFAPKKTAYESLISTVTKGENDMEKEIDALKKAAEKDYTQRLKEYESWLTIVPKPQEYTAQTT